MSVFALARPKRASITLLRDLPVRIEDPLRQWKRSPTDLESRRLWYDYSLARDKAPMKKRRWIPEAY